MGDRSKAFQRPLGLRPLFNMTKMSQAQSTVFHFFDIRASLLNVMDFGQLVQSVDDLDRQFTVGGIGDRFLLDAGIDVDRPFQCSAAV